MSILGWIIIGGLAGWVASLIVTDHGSGILMNIVIGIVGALIGGFIVGIFGGSGITGFNIWSFVVALIGSIVLLWLVGMFRGGRTAS